MSPGLGNPIGFWGFSWAYGGNWGFGEVFRVLHWVFRVSHWGFWGYLGFFCGFSMEFWGYLGFLRFLAEFLGFLSEL